MNKQLVEVIECNGAGTLSNNVWSAIFEKPSLDSVNIANTMHFYSYYFIRMETEKTISSTQL